MRLRRIPVSLLAAAALVAGCTTTVAIRSTEPGRVYVGATQHIVLLDGQGRRSAREMVAIELMNQARARGFFSVEDRSEDGFEVRIAGRRASVSGGAWAGEQASAGLRMDVLEWTSQRDQEEVRRFDAEGNAYYEAIPVQVGTVLLAVTLFDPEGHAYLAEAEYEGRYATRDMQMPRDDVIDLAAGQAIGQFLHDITPIQVVSQVRLDDSDPGQEAILATAKAGSIAKAAEDMAAYLERDPHNAVAAYNLAVFLEAQGRYSEALETYDRALSAGFKDYYAGARAQCARRVASAEALQGR